MIPKTIHYCWFGGLPLPRSAKKVLQTWKLHCPEYTLIEWNEGNFNIDACKYIREAYRARKFAFVSDYARLDVLHRYGGIYLDTDYELLKSLDPLLYHEAFFGFETNRIVATSILGAAAQMPVLSQLLESYATRSFIGEDGEYDLTPNPLGMTRCLQDTGFIMNGETQTLENMTLLAREYLMPLNGSTLKMDCLSTHSYGYHHFSASWLPFSVRAKIMIKRHLPQGVVKRLQHQQRGSSSL